MTDWEVETHRGTAGALHGLEVPDDGRRRMWILEASGPAVVLGSTQAATDVDTDAAHAAGVDVVRRRSGGGAVWIAPDEIVWIDVVLPRGDPAWREDVGASFAPVGRAWADALTTLGIADLVVHAGAMVHSPWSRTVCFAGVGPGEVGLPQPQSVTGMAKVVGIAQRRSRAGARFQCAIPRRWDPTILGALLVDDVPVADLRAVGEGVGALSTDTLAEAFIASFY